MSGEFAFKIKDCQWIREKKTEKPLEIAPKIFKFKLLCGSKNLQNIVDFRVEQNKVVEKVCRDLWFISLLFCPYQTFEFTIQSHLKVDSEVEMSDLSSPSRLRGENSNCESQSSRDTRRKRQMEKVKSRRKKKSERNSTSTAANQQDSDDSDAQLQYEERPASSINSSYTSAVSDVQVEKMRRRLQFFFMNPIEKWHAKKRWANP